jgi:hypothetical protein
LSIDLRLRDYLFSDLYGAASGAARLPSSIMSGAFADGKASTTLQAELNDAAQQ